MAHSGLVMDSKSLVMKRYHRWRYIPREITRQQIFSIKRMNLDKSSHETNSNVDLFKNKINTIQEI